MNPVLRRANVVNVYIITDETGSFQPVSFMNLMKKVMTGL